MTPEAEVVVVGGGPAGIAAAVGAARSGRSTLLLEKEAHAGGIPVKGNITTLCGFHVTGPGRNNPQILNKGFPAEFVAALARRDRGMIPVRMGKAYVLPCRVSDFSGVAAGFLNDEPRLAQQYGAEFRGVEVNSGRIGEVVVDFKGRRHRVRAGAVIDASGDAVVFRGAGAAVMEPDEARQVPALMFPLHRINLPDCSAMGFARLLLAIRHAVESGGLPPEAGGVVFMRASEPESIVIKLNLGFLVKAGSWPPGRIMTETANELKHAIVRFLVRHVPGFGGCIAPAGASPVLHRDGHRGVGGYVLSTRDVLAGRKFPDAVAKGCWPMEMWDEGGNCRVEYLPDGAYYDIPGGALQSAEIENLFMAGKCISADAGAIASARVIGCCLATGEAAAKLAAGCV